MIAPVHLETIERVTLGIFDQLCNNKFLDPLQEVLQARWVRQVMEELLCFLILRLCLGEADGGGHGLDLGLCTVHCSGLTASLQHSKLELDRDLSSSGVIIMIFFFF